MSTSGGATWKQLHKSLDDGYTLAVGSMLYQAGMSASSRSTARAMAVSRSSDGKKWEEVILSKEYGSVKAIAVHPRNKRLVFAGGHCTSNRPVGSRLYRSTDAGATWSEVTELAGRGSCVNGIAIDPAAPNRVLAALDKGVFVSEDGGKTWTEPGQTVPGTCI